MHKHIVCIEIVNNLKAANYSAKPLKMFKYLVCLDFKTTCWPNNFNQQNAEIIEISAVLLNIANGSIEDSFHRFVRPTQYSRLSSYCINVTGITQDVANCQEPFNLVYGHFIAWLSKMQSEKRLHYSSISGIRASNSPNATFCSWSSWNLNFYFRMECERHGIQCPSCLKVWIDVSRKFNQKYWNRFGARLLNFSEALRCANIQSIVNPTEYFGIDNVLNLSSLVVHLIGIGARFEIATDSYQFNRSDD